MLTIAYSSHYNCDCIYQAKANSIPVFNQCEEDKNLIKLIMIA